MASNGKDDTEVYSIDEIALKACKYFHYKTEAFLKNSLSGSITELIPSGAVLSSVLSSFTADKDLFIFYICC